MAGADETIVSALLQWPDKGACSGQGLARNVPQLFGKLVPSTAGPRVLVPSRLAQQKTMLCMVCFLTVP